MIRPEIAQAARLRCDELGLDFRVGSGMVRVLGYSPRSLELFDQ